MFKKLFRDLFVVVKEIEKAVYISTIGPRDVKYFLGIN